MISDSILCLVIVFFAVSAVLLVLPAPDEGHQTKEHQEEDQPTHYYDRQSGQVKRYWRLTLPSLHSQSARDPAAK